MMYRKLSVFWSKRKHGKPYKIKLSVLWRDEKLAERVGIMPLIFFCL